MNKMKGAAQRVCKDVPHLLRKEISFDGKGFHIFLKKE
jgi:hypothetical protein